jgi:hypothetical protein
MFSVQQKRQIADAVQRILRETGHPELPPGEINFLLHVEGAETWSWADIRNNGAVSAPAINPWNEAQAKHSAPGSGPPWPVPSRRGSNPPPPGSKPAPPASPPTADLALRVQRLEAMRETEKAALLDAFLQIDELKQRLDFQYSKLCKIEESIIPEAHD